MDNSPNRSVDVELPEQKVLSPEQGFEIFKKFDFSTQQEPQESTTATPEPPAEEVVTEPSAPSAEPIEEVADVDDQEDDEVTVSEEPEAVEASDDKGEDDLKTYIPESFEELAEAFGVDPMELAARFNVSAKIGGVKQSKPLSEVLTDYQLRQVSDQKMQELAEQRKAMDAALREQQENWQAQTDSLEVAIKTIDANLDMYPDEMMKKLLAEGNNQAYMWADDRRKALENARSTAVAELEKRKAEADEGFQSSRVQRLNREKQIIGQLRPELTDPTKAAEQQNKLSNYLIQNYQIPPESVEQYWNGNWSAYEVDMFLKAMAYDEMKATSRKRTATKNRQKIGKVMKAGTPTPKAAPEEESRRSAAAKFRKATKNPRGQTKRDVETAALEWMHQLRR